MFRMPRFFGRRVDHGCTQRSSINSKPESRTRETVSQGTAILPRDSAPRRRRFASDWLSVTVCGIALRHFETKAMLH